MVRLASALSFSLMLVGGFVVRLEALAPNSPLRMALRRHSHRPRTAGATPQRHGQDPINPDPHFARAINVAS
jgi:hypothetical protein